MSPREFQGISWDTGAIASISGNFKEVPGGLWGASVYLKAFQGISEALQGVPGVFRGVLDAFQRDLRGVRVGSWTTWGASYY